MDNRVKDSPLDLGEIGQLGRFLSKVTNPRALPLEGVDGLLCALIAGPAWVVPADCVPLLWGGPLPDEMVTFNLAHANAMIRLLTRHWNSILSELERGADHVPLIAGVDSGIPGRAWAQGFMRGVNFVQVGWNELLQDVVSSGIHRISQLAQEAGSAVQLNVNPQSCSQEMLPWLGRAVADAYQYFLDRRCADRLMVELSADVASRWHNSPDLPP